MKTTWAACIVHHDAVDDLAGCLASLRAQTREMIEKRLNPSHGEGRDHHRPASLDASLDMISKRLCRIDLLVAPIAIGRFHQDIVGARGRLGILHHRIAVTADIA